MLRLEKGNVLYVPHNSEEIRFTSKLKHNLSCENKLILLMISDNKKWHYLAVKRLSALLRIIISKDYGDFYCLNCLHLFRTENKLKEHENICENHGQCYLEMPNKYNKTLKHNSEEKSMKAPFIIYSDLKSLLEKMSSCHDNPKNSSTTKINKHIASGYSLFTHCSFDATKNKLDYYRIHDCMKECGRISKGIQQT